MALLLHFQYTFSLERRHFSVHNPLTRYNFREEKTDTGVRGKQKNNSESVKVVLFVRVNTSKVYGFP